MNPSSVPGGGPAHWSHHGTQRQQRSWISTQTLVPIGPAHSPWWSPDLDITVVLSGKQTSLLSLLLTTITTEGGKLFSNICPILSVCLSSFMCLPMMYEPFHFSNLPNSLPPYILKMNGSCLSSHQSRTKDPGWLSSHLLGRSQLGSSVRTFFKQVWLSSQGPWLVFRMNMFKHFLIVIVKKWM